MNVVPSASTVRVVEAMLLAARKSNGADAALRHLRDIRPDQVAALVGVLLNVTASAEAALHHARFAIPDLHTPEQRRLAHAAYARGIRDPWAIAGEREYQRNRKRVYARRRTAA